MSRLQTASPESVLSDSFRNIRLSSAQAIRVEKSALIQLEMHVQASLRFLNARGLEVGGLVVGSALTWKAAEVVITGFLPVEIEYRFGPVFRPSESDIAAFSEAAKNVQDDTVIGYFRTHLRDQLSLRAEDRRLLAQLFPQVDSCFIGISASAGAPSIANVYQVQAGADPVLLERFALRENETVPPVVTPPVKAEPLVTPPVVTPPVVTPQVVTSPVSPLKQPPSQPASEPAVIKSAPNWISWRGILPGSIAVLVIAGVAYTMGRGSATVPTNAPVAPIHKPLPSLTSDSRIDLHIVERGTQLEINWNAADPAIVTAARGMLIVTDTSDPGENNPTASTPGDIDLDGAQLRSGHFLYKSANNALSVLLMIYQPDGSFTGDIKDLNHTPPAQLPPPVVSSLSPTPKPPPAQEVRKHDVQKHEVQKEVPKTVAAKPARSWSAPPPAPASQIARAPAILEPPPVSTVATISALKLPALPVPSPPVVPPPVFAAPHPNLTYRAPAPTRYLAPRVVHQVVPAVPLGIAPRIHTEVELEVSVTLDMDGKVTGAHIIASQGAAAGLLAIEALKAAQLCRFLPAQQDGRPVPGNTVLTFRFAPRPN